MHNLTKDPPFSRLDLVSCRNVLIYFDRELQRQACGIFNYALRSGGFLFLGASENAETPPAAFRVIDRDARIYQSSGRKGTAILPTQHGFESSRLQAPQIPVLQTRTAVLGEASLHRHLLEETAPPSVLLDSSHRVLHLSESAGRFLQLPGGPPTPDIGELIRPELRLDLLSALSRAFERQLPTLTVPVRVTFNGTGSQVQLQVKPVFKENTRPAALVFFIEASAAEFPGAEFPSFESADAVSNGARHALSEELESNKAQLRTSRQDYEAAIEELRAANEELQSVGEEYRSTAEELETSREELQSINEELQAVNHELKLKLETISGAHSDLQNLILATDVGTLFLDSNLRIRRFTPTVADLFNITMSDEGRPISDFTHRLLNYRGLDHDARGVLADLSPIESEVQSDSGRWYLARMRPYRTIEDRIEGVVVTFVDITERRAEQRALRESETRLQLAREATSLGIFDYNADAGVFWFDKRCRELWGIGETGEVNLGVFLAGVAESHRTDAHEALHRAFDQDSDGVFSLEFRSSDPSKEQWLRAVGKVFFTGDGASHEAPRLVGSIQNISATKAWESRQKLLLRELSHRVKNTLAVVNAMARQTLRDDTRPEALEKYEARILALSDAHDLLVQSEWQGAEVGALVNRLLAAYSDSNRGRITITGPELLLPAYLAAPFAMLLHELAANAAKYGALGERGTVGITWRVLLQRDERLLEFVWKESGGPPVFADSPSGFGTFFIENGLPDAKVERQLNAGGLICRIELPV